MSSSTIVVGVDGSEPSVEALHWAVGQAKLTGDRVVAVIGWEYPATGWAGMMPGQVIPVDFDAEKLAGQILDDTLAKHLDPETAASVERRVVDGPAAQVLIDNAEGASLLVVGDRGHSGVKAVLLGSVSANVTQHATCPVVVVRGGTTAD
ncbi:universal stress protein [Streptomyces sp. NPDC012623]|uniref:universal stress protein n=1 Tax=unclassified Streptomyces TaxID=2593676 RepID=UPI0036B407F9